MSDLYECKDKKGVVLLRLIHYVQEQLSLSKQGAAHKSFKSFFSQYLLMFNPILYEYMLKIDKVLFKSITFIASRYRPAQLTKAFQGLPEFQNYRKLRWAALKSNLSLDYLRAT